MRCSLLILAIFSTLMGWGQSHFERDFRDSTLRVDYSFVGNHQQQIIALEELRSAPKWAGRRVNLATLPLKGNGQITMRDAETQRVIYTTSFSSLFQEWQTTEEATQISKAFENVFQLPMPKRDADVTVTLFDTRQRISAQFTHRVKVNDILIRPTSISHLPNHRVLHQGGDTEKCIDIAIVAEGYTSEERELFYEHAQAAANEILKYKPFCDYLDRINIIGVALNSRESGVSAPGKGIWKQTALKSNFDTFYSERYLTTLHLKQLNDSLAGLPYEHIVILANTQHYGGGGIYNSYTLAAAKHAMFLPVVVHEFGHSFGGLADEYFYDDQYEQFYFPEVEPWEQNITTLQDFSAKWKDMLPKETPIPTSTEGISESDMEHIGVFEGGGYQSKGVYRAFRDCRMRTNGVPEFCKVCQRALERLIRFYTEDLKYNKKNN